MFDLETDKVVLLSLSADPRFYLQQSKLKKIKALSLITPK